jgi:monoamine oxidase
MTADGGPPASRREQRLRALYAGEGLPRVRGQSPRVAVIGAGLAGLTAASLLSTSGCTVALFEAAARVGGRVWTERAGPNGAGSVVECGGEFVDTQHADLLALVRHLGLELLDTGAPSEQALQAAYHFGGQRYSETQFDAAFAAAAPQIQRDIASCSARVARRRHTETDRRFDQLSIAEYLQGLAAEPWLRRAIEVAYVTVYGLDAGEQSSLNLLSLIGADASRGLSIFGDSDERWKVRDGSEHVARGLAAHLEGHVYPGHRLVRLRRHGEAYRLALDRGAGAVEIDADVVMLALPFTMLREVDLGDLLPPHKRRAVDELGYGHNSKLMVGMNRRVWREQGFEGGITTDLDFQTTWECSRARAAEPAIFTYYLGGHEGIAVGQGDAHEVARRYAQATDGVFAGFSDALSGFVRRVVWRDEPFARGSYTCYRPGQWTTIAGDEDTPVGRLYFAGEHCATASQGYMDGAVQAGREAALEVLKRWT